MTSIKAAFESLSYVTKDEKQILKIASASKKVSLSLQNTSKYVYTTLEAVQELIENLIIEEKESNIYPRLDDALGIANKVFYKY